MAGLIAFALTHIRGILVTVAIGIAIAAVVGLKHGYDEGKRDEGRAEVRTKELEPLQKQVKAAQERASALALQWDQQRQAAEAAGRERDEERTKRFADAEQRARVLPAAVAAVRIPEPVRSLLNDAVDSTVAAPSAPGKPVEAPPAAPEVAVGREADGTTLGAMTEWAVQVLAVCTEYRDRALGLIRFYESLRASQSESGAEGASTPAAP